MQQARRSNLERSAATQAALVAAARRLFITAGFGETSTPDIAAEAGVTRGALYHHFADKTALFAAVVRTEAAAVAAEIDGATPAGLPPLEALAEGGRAFLEAMQVPGRTRLLLLDGPAVLGRAFMDELDGQHGGGTLRQGLSEAMASGAIEPLPLDALTTALSAMFDRAALAVAEGADAEAFNEVWRAILAGLGGEKPSAG